MLPENSSDLLAFYTDHLEQQILPFWLKQVDHKHGGVFTCLSNDGRERSSTDKFTWSQGRFAWLMARATALSNKGLLSEPSDTYLRIAEKTVSFLEKYVVLENGHCAYLLSAKGEPKEFLPGEGHDISYFADCFVILGFSEYARVIHNRELLEKALNLYDSLKLRLATGQARSEPYPVPQGCQTQAQFMIMLNVSQELELALAQAEHPRAADVKADSLGYLEKIFEHFLAHDNSLKEIICGGKTDSILSNHRTPGHAIECMWFVMETARRYDLTDKIEQAIKVVKRSFKLGWDTVHGGLFRFVSSLGAEPQGKATERFEQLILETWDTKIWWPHSEALYTSLLGFHLTGDRELLTVHQKIHDYTFATFPHPDKEVGEWIQIRNRQGKPLNKVVALPVKDPYHIARNLMLLIELLASLQTETRLHNAQHD